MLSMMCLQLSVRLTIKQVQYGSERPIYLKCIQQVSYKYMVGDLWRRQYQSVVASVVAVIER